MVDGSGDYCMTADHEWLPRHFDIVTISDEDDFYGTDRPVLTALPQDQSAEHVVGGNGG
jgi:hypothetical protein